MKNAKSYILATLLILNYCNAWSKDTLQVCSPAGKICVKIWMEETLNYRIDFNGESLLGPSEIDLLLSNYPNFSFNNRIKSHSIKKVNDVIISPVPEKRKRIPNDYNEMSITFKQPYKVE